MHDKIFGFNKIKFVRIAKLFQRSFSQNSKYRSQQKLSTINKNDCLKEEIRDYVVKNNPHEYKLYAVVADAAPLTFLQRKVNKQLGEPFSSNSSVWHFPYYSLNDERVLEDTCNVKVEIKGIGDYSSNVYRKGYETLQQYVNGEVLDQEVIPAFTALERFYNNKGTCMSCILIDFFILQTFDSRQYNYSSHKLLCGKTLWFSGQGKPLWKVKYSLNLVYF